MSITLAFLIGVGFGLCASDLPPPRWPRFP